MDGLFLLFIDRLSIENEQMASFNQTILITTIDSIDYSYEMLYNIHDNVAKMKDQQ